MTTKLSISAKEDKDKLVITECTGKYKGDNKHGWGLPNTTLSSVTHAQFEIYPPTQTSATIINISPDFPTDDTDLGYEIPATTFGMTTLESGVWKIGYRVNGIINSIPYEYYTERRFIFTQQAQCCVDKLMGITVNVPVQTFLKDDKKKAATELYLLMTDALWAKQCNNFDAAQKILKYINLQCQNCC